MRKENDLALKGTNILAAQSLRPFQAIFSRRVLYSGNPERADSVRLIGVVQRV